MRSLTDFNKFKALRKFQGNNAVGTLQIKSEDKFQRRFNKVVEYQIRTTSICGDLFAAASAGVEVREALSEADAFKQGIRRGGSPRCAFGYFSRKRKVT